MKYITYKGSESTVDIYDDVVIKIYNDDYYKWNITYDRRGEAYFLNKFHSPYFVEIQMATNKHIVMPNTGQPIGSRRRGLDDKHYPGLVYWLKGLREELTRLGIEHRDINPGNILYNGKDYTLIDFNWAVMKKDNPKLKNHPPYLNKKYGTDEAAIDKISQNAINIMLSKIGKKRYDGSSLRKGWTYHPVPFEEFNSGKCHKDAAISEYKDVLEYCPFVKDGNKNILDIGSNIGYFSFQLAQLGNVVVGVEADPVVLEAAQAIRLYKNIWNINFIQIIDTNVLDHIIDFDLVLLLNTHMWIYKQLGAKRTIELMKKLASKTKYMLFQTAGKESGGKYRIKKLVDRTAIRDYLEKCGFNGITFLRDTTVHGGIRSLFLCKGDK